MTKTIDIYPGTSIAEVLENISGRVILNFHKGVYEEKLSITKDGVTFFSDEGAVISFSDHHGTIRDGKVLGTGDSASVTLAAADFQAEGITFRNSFDYKTNHEANLKGEGEKVGTQAVALRTIAGAESASFKNCCFEGFQDTLFLDAGSAYFENCQIKGNVDFIFGAGNALFKECELVVLPYSEEAYITAPSTKNESDLGFVFLDCVIRCEAGVENVFLGRPWHPSSDPVRSCNSAFLNCSLPKEIDKAIWCSMMSKSTLYTPEDSIFLEYGSKGECADEDRDLLTDEAYQRFMLSVKEQFSGYLDI